VDFVKRNNKKSNRLRRAKRMAWLLLQRAKKLRRSKKYKHNCASGHSISRSLHSNSHTKKSISLDENHRIVVDLPNELDFEKNYERTVSHFLTLRSAISKGNTFSKLDFSHIRKISTSAALVLASLVDQWNLQIGGKLYADISTWDDEIKRLFCQMGYFELLGIEKPTTTWPESHITFLHFKRGEVNSENSGELAKQLRVEIEHMVGQKIKKHFLFEGLSEAITNVGQHAYRDAGDHIRKNWWVSASFDSNLRRLCVTFYDRGHGIPHTLPKSKFFEKIKDAFNHWSDSAKIEAATEIGRTSSGRAERGKGLQNLVEFAKAHKNGSLLIYSLKGVYIQKFANMNSDPIEQTRLDFANSIGGTLIEWSVEL
jgi:anti-anti-sigma regulatory factor